eukprot:TRINITY_DN14482_c0_g1_i1.p1 TRINITY_DN14482_c0_g1~~TRINITY_DN14482_c0_g1_i1.p1  ORF type:complete len:141 (+),score=14.19 TRINITY_DN14482_c0_g1_i1:53-475(+)
MSQQRTKRGRDEEIIPHTSLNAIEVKKVGFDYAAIHHRTLEKLTYGAQMEQQHRAQVQSEHARLAHNGRTTMTTTNYRPGCFRCSPQLSTTHICSSCHVNTCADCIRSCDGCQLIFCSTCVSVDYTLPLERSLCIDCMRQ